MTVATINLPPESWVQSDGSTTNAAPAFTRRKGSGTAPVQFFTTLDFDASTQENVSNHLHVPQNYASGPVLRITWRANATTGSVVWGSHLAAITPGDAVTREAKAFATATSATTAVSGTARNEVVTTITYANLDSMAAGDGLLIHLFRDAANASDTCTVDAEIVDVSLDYTTT